MSKRFREKNCVYCNQRESTETGDHIFPRKLFLERRRHNLPKVPCCTICNSEKSKLETYLLAILPFGANHSDALENLATNEPKRLNKNFRLHRNLQITKGSVFINNENGILVPTLTVNIDINMLFDLFNYITKALIYAHFNLRITTNHVVNSSNTDPRFLNFFNGIAKNKVENNLGNGTVWYRGIQAKDNEFATLWQYRIYGGLQLLGQQSGDIISYSIRDKIQRNIDLYSIFGI